MTIDSLGPVLVTKPFSNPVQQYSAPARSYRLSVGTGLWLSLGCLAMSLLMIVGVIMGVSTPEPETGAHPPDPSPLTAESVDFSQPAWAVQVPTLRRVRSLPTEPPQRHPLAPSIYKKTMAIGYQAYQQGDYQTALINFRRALTEKSGDRYATEAIANTEAIIQKQKQQQQQDSSQAE